MHSEAVHGLHPAHAVVSHSRVSEHVGDALYANRTVAAKTAMLLDYRKKILTAANGKAGKTRIAVARYHYDQCLEWVAKAGLKPEKSARLLIETMRSRF